jgi:hypothetical protein
MQSIKINANTLIYTFMVLPHFYKMDGSSLFAKQTLTFDGIMAFGSIF